MLLRYGMTLGIGITSGRPVYPRPITLDTQQRPNLAHMLLGLEGTSVTLTLCRAPSTETFRVTLHRSVAAPSPQGKRLRQVKGGDAGGGGEGRQAGRRENSDS